MPHPRGSLSDALQGRGGGAGQGRALGAGGQVLEEALGLVGPQALERAVEEAAHDGFIGTDEASLVERSGQPVAVVMGSPRNLKITTPADLQLAEFYLKLEKKH